MQTRCEIHGFSVETRAEAIKGKLRLLIERRSKWLTLSHDFGFSISMLSNIRASDKDELEVRLHKAFSAGKGFIRRDLYSWIDYIIWRSLLEISIGKSRFGKLWKILLKLLLPIVYAAYQLTVGY